MLAIERNFETPCHAGSVEVTCSVAGVACESMARISTGAATCRKNIVPTRIMEVNSKDGSVLTCLFGANRLNEYDINADSDVIH